MSGDQVRLRCVVMRGGTSKGVFFMGNELPAAPPLREKVILRVFGSPDVRQIDGLGGANSLTSKVAIIEPSSRPGADVDYTFGQVSVTNAVIDWKGNCGNISSAVGAFAVDEGLVRAQEPVTPVRIFNTNTSKMIVAQVPVKDGKAVSRGDYRIPGVPGAGAKITLEFVEPAGSVTGRLLPTGRAVDVIKVDGWGEYTVSIVDAGNPTVFLKAQELGLAGTELPADLETNQDLMNRIEMVRSVAAEMIGVVASRRDATKKAPAIPKIGFVAPPADYVNPEGRAVAAGEVDFVARLCSMQKMHRAYMVTGAVATACAARIPGTVVFEAARPESRTAAVVRIGQPYGMMDVTVHLDREGRPERVGVGRTARRIMEGYAYVPADIFE